MSRVPAKTPASAPLPASGADPPRVGSALASAAAVQLTCPCCQHPITVFLSTLALANPDLPMVTPRQPPPAWQEGNPGSLDTQGLANGSSQEGAKAASSYVFRRVGKRWEVVLPGGRAFRLRNSLGARYLNYLLHEPNEPIHAFDLEVEIQPQKGEARAVNSIQPESDPKALREYRKDLERLKAERAKAQAAGDRAKVEALNGQIAALESALKPGGAAADTGERARDNVRKALAVVKKQLRGGGPEERAFAEHLRTHLSIGYECLYSHPQGRIWG